MRLAAKIGLPLVGVAGGAAQVMHIMGRPVAPAKPADVPSSSTATAGLLP